MCDTTVPLRYMSVSAHKEPHHLDFNLESIPNNQYVFICSMYCQKIECIACRANCAL